MSTDSGIVYFMEVRVNTYGAKSSVVILENNVFQRCFMSFTHEFGFATELPWTGCELKVIKQLWCV